MNFSTIKNRNSFLIQLLLIPTWICLNQSSAQAVTFNTLNQNQIAPVLEAFSAATTFRSIDGPSHPSVFGFFFNVRGSSSSSDGLKELLGANQSSLPFAHVQAGVNLPFGLGFEVGVLPSLSIPGTGTSVSSLGLGVKLNLTKTVLSALPVDIAVRGIYTHSSFAYEGTISAANTTVDVKSTVMGGSIDVGKAFLGILQPYVGLGLLNQNSDMGYTGSTSVFGGNVTLNNGRAASTTTSLWLKAGLGFSFLGIDLGAQYERVFNSNVLSAKVGFKF